MHLHIFKPNQPTNYVHDLLETNQKLRYRTATILWLILNLRENPRNKEYS